MSETIPIWKAIEESRGDIHELKTKFAVVDHRLSAQEKSMADTCAQLIKTETRVMDTVSKIEQNQQALIIKLAKEDGAKSVLKYIPTLFQTIILVSSVLALVRSFH